MSNHYLNQLELFIKSSRGTFEDLLGQLVETPTVSMDPAREEDIRKGANLAADFLRSFGADAKLYETSGNPVVVGRFTVPGAKQTLTIYNHIDVQPAQEPEWVRDPFVFVKDNGRYYGRGATDDKGPALSALMAARYAMENQIPLNIQFIWEFEEEIGSPHFEEFIKANLSRLKTDSVLVSDTLWLSRTKPSIPYGLRGLFTGIMKLQTHEKDAHSGVTGGAARNPLGELAQVISQCYDARSGKVKIPGFYDDVKKASKKEIENFVSSGFNLKNWRKVFQFKSLRTNNTAEVLERIWALPTFEVHGISGGYTGPGVKTVVPPRGEVKFSCRLVPNQNPEKIFKQVKSYIKKINPDVEVLLDGKLDPYLGDLSNAYTKFAVDAIEYGFSASPTFIREGGSIGAVVTMQKYLKAPIIFIGLSLPEHGYHAPNENFDWGQASGGIKTFAKYFVNVAEIK